MPLPPIPTQDFAKFQADRGHDEATQTIDSLFKASTAPDTIDQMYQQSVAQDQQAQAATADTAHAAASDNLARLYADSASRDQWAKPSSAAPNAGPVDAGAGPIAPKALGGAAPPPVGDVAGWRSWLLSRPEIPDALKADPAFVDTVLAGGQAESGLDPKRVQQGGGGRGVFQFDVQGGMGTGVPDDQLFDPGYQASRIIPEYVRAWQSAPEGLSPAEKASWVAAHAERPYDYENPDSTARRNYAAAYQTVSSTAGGGDRVAVAAQPPPAPDFTVGGKLTESQGAEEAPTDQAAQDAGKRGADEAPTPDLPSLPWRMANPFGPSVLPFLPSKPVQPDRETRAKILLGEPLDAQDFVSLLTKAASSQQTTTPAAAEAMGLHVGTPEEDLAKGFAAGATEGGASSVAGGGKLLAAGDVGAGTGAADLAAGLSELRAPGVGVNPNPEQSVQLAGNAGVARGERLTSGRLSGTAALAADAPTGDIVPVSPFEIRAGVGDKATAGDIRTELSGVRNAQIVRGNQLADQIRTMAPDEQSAMFWYKAADGDRAVLKQMAEDPNPRLDPYRDDIWHALDLSPKAQDALALGDRYYAEQGQASQALGTIGDVRENYQNRIYQPEPPKDVVKTETGPGLAQSTSHAQQRVFDDEFQAVLAGKKFATTNYADALAIHNEEMARVNANRQMAGAMQDNGLGAWVRPDKIPDDWKPVGTLQKNVPIKDADGNAVIGPDGNQVVSHSVFAAPRGIADGLASIADPSVLNKVDALRGIQRFQGVVKTVDLSLSAFHHFTMGMQTLYQLANDPGGLASVVKGLPKLTDTLTSGPFRDAEQDFARSGGITAKVADNLDVLRSLRAPADDVVSRAVAKVGSLPGVSQAAGAVDASTNFLFGKVQRYLKVMDYQNKVAGWVAQHPEAADDALVAAKRGYAREVNAAYGGLNWEQMGVSRDGLRAMRLAILAPDWTVSNLNLAKYALTDKGTAGMAARRHFAGAVASGVLLTEGLNYLLTGHPSTDNPPGHQFEVQVAPNVYVSMFRGGIGDVLKLASNVAESGPVEGAARFGQGKLAPIPRTVVGALANTDYTGRQIAPKGAGFVKNALSGVKYVATSLLPVPLGLGNAESYREGGNVTPAGAAAVLSGVGRYSTSGQPKATTPKNEPPPFAPSRSSPVAPPNPFKKGK